MSEPLSYGEKAVGLSFNPSGSPDVQLIKEKCAELIDLINDARDSSRDGEAKRLYSLAITDLQVAQMWAVKAATWKP